MLKSLRCTLFTCILRMSSLIELVTRASVYFAAGVNATVSPVAVGT